MGSSLSKEQEVYLRVLLQLLWGASCKVKEQHLMQLLRTIKEYYPDFPDKGTLGIEVWEEAGNKLKSLQDSGVSIRTQNLLTWGLVKTALMPIWAKRQELVTEEDKESSSEEEVTYDVVEEPAMKVLPTAPPEDLPRSQRSLLQLQELPPHRMTLHQDSQKIQTGILLGSCDSAFGKQ